MADNEQRHPYVIFILLLSILSLVVLAVSSTGHLSPDQNEILDMADLALCAMFFIDFLVTLYRAPNRMAYFLSWGWLDLLSSIPMVGPLRAARAARVVRILRLIRGVKATRILAQFILKSRAQSAFLAVSLISLLMVVVSSIAILQVEDVAGANITSAADAIWWAMTTITTVGYGDRFPVTPEGRVIAAMLMVCGVGLFGTLSGFIASWFLKPEQDQRDSEMATLLAEIRELKQQLQAGQDDGGKVAVPVANETRS